MNRPETGTTLLRWPCLFSFIDRFSGGRRLQVVIRWIVIGRRFSMSGFDGCLRDGFLNRRFSMSETGTALLRLFEICLNLVLIEDDDRNTRSVLSRGSCSDLKNIFVYLIVDC
ncbi:hypothetical protein HanIR_Chr17g0886211 [Helianthus annuus]|nr:hypothetical protein HanIR_Chr17g0886211 [Helianthus annuus]